MNHQCINNKNLESKPLCALYLIATPIGNMQDMTFRAVNLIKELDFIYCEDPKQTAKILNYFNITKKLYKYNDHSDKILRDKIIDLLKQGCSVGLLSDAGTPTISDPGYKLVKEVTENGLDIYSIPGACAAITALSCSAMPTDNFHFFGFAPRKKVQLEKYLANLTRYQGSLIFYETARRIIDFFAVAKNVFPHSKSFVARELTKIYEEKIYGDIEELYVKLQKKEHLKGEFVIVIHNNKNEKNVTFENDLDKVVAAGRKYFSLKDLSKFLSEVTNLNKNDIYKIAIAKEADR